MSKVLVSHSTIAGAILSCCLSLFSPIPLAVAQSAPSSSSPASESWQFNQRSVPDRDLRGLSGRGAPQRRTAAGTRGDCPAVAETEPGLMALVPLSQGTVDGTAKTVAIGITAAEYPTFWVYIPYSIDEINTVRFVLLDDTEKPVTEPLEVPIVGELPGIIGFQLPETETPLEIGRYYRWYITIDCQPASSTDIFVEALVQRINAAPEVMRSLNGIPPREQAVIYAQNGYWHESFTLLQSLKQSAPDPAVQSDWSTLLRSVGLTELAGEQ